MYDDDDKVLIRPAVAGTKVRIPNTLDVLPDEGRRMLPNDYWRRMEGNGEVVIIKQAPEQAQEQPQQPQQPQRRRSGGEREGE